MKEQEAVARAMAALDTMATIWAAKAEIRKGVCAMLQLPDAEDRLMALIKQAHAEGLYEGRMSLRTSPRPQLDVQVERGRVWIKRGAQSFMLAFDSDVAEEREWYAESLRNVLDIDGSRSVLSDSGRTE